jgi:hypothetical protein
MPANSSISATHREKLTSEIDQISVKQSGKEKEGNLTKYSIDRDWSTSALVRPNKDNGYTWLELTLPNVFCINQVIVRRKKAQGLDVWSCQEDKTWSCENWVGKSECSGYTVIIKNENNSIHVNSSASGDRPVCATETGDTIVLKRNDTTHLWVTEVIVTKHIGWIALLSY